MPTPSWDLAITIFFLLGIAFGYIMQRDKIMATMLSVYVGLIVTQVLAGTMEGFFQGNTTLFDQVWIRSNANPFTIRVLIFGAVIALVSAKANFSSGKSKGILSPIEVIICSVLTSGLILSSIFHFMPQASLDAFTVSSKMARLVIDNYLWWVLLPVIFIIAAGFLHKGSSSSSSSD